MASAHNPSDHCRTRSFNEYPCHVRAANAFNEQDRDPAMLRNGRKPHTLGFEAQHRANDRRPNSARPVNSRQQFWPGTSPMHSVGTKRRVQRDLEIIPAIFQACGKLVCTSKQCKPTVAPLRNRLHFVTVIIPSVTVTHRRTGTETLHYGQARGLLNLFTAAR